MNRQEFMRQLEYLLRDIPETERADALAYYNNYFDEAGVENEQQVLQKLGSPEAVAQTILEDVQDETQRTGQDYYSPEIVCEEKQTQDTSVPREGMSKSIKILIIILLVLTFPLWIGIVAGLFGGLVGLIGGLFGVLIGLIGAAIGLVAGGVGCVIGGILCIFASPVKGLACIGVGAILTAIGVLLALLSVLIVGLWLPKLVKALVNWIKGLFHRNEGGNEI